MDGRLKLPFHPALWCRLLIAYGWERVAFRSVWVSGKVKCPCFSTQITLSIFRSWLVAFIAVLVILPTHTAFAGRYELVKGKGVEVCEAYQMNLNSYHPAEPLRCDRPVNPKFKDFQKPEWEQIDALKDFDLIVKVDQLLNPRDYKYRPELSPKSLRSNIETGNYKFSLVTVDIDNDGQTEPVLRYLDSCWPGSKGPWGTPLVVLQQDRRDADQAKSEQVATGHGVAGYQGSIYDIFRYKDLTYFDYWSEETGPLRVMLTKQGATTEICRLRFTH